MPAPAPAPPELSAAYLGYVDALRAGDGARACGLATENAKTILVHQADPNAGPEFCPQVVAGFAESVRRFAVPVVETGSIAVDRGELIVNQPYKEGTNLKRRISLRMIEGRWLFDGLTNISLTE